MYQSQEKRAWNRGVRFAGIWKRARTTLLNWDKRCVSWAATPRLPSWCGHIPMIPIACFVILTFGSLFLISAVLSPHRKHLSESENAPCGNFMGEQPGYGKYRDGQHGWGWYDAAGRMVNEDE